MPARQFLDVTHPANLDQIHGRPQVDVVGSTLPWSFVEIKYTSEDQEERYLSVQADDEGAFSASVPLAERTNVLEITSYHGTSDQQARRFLQLSYFRTAAPLELVIIEPASGATLPYRVLTVIGKTAPNAEVVINDRIHAHPDDEGRWEARMFLQRGTNQIRVIAMLESQTASVTINVEYEPDQG